MPHSQCCPVSTMFLLLSTGRCCPEPTLCHDLETMWRGDGSPDVTILEFPLSLSYPGLTFTATNLASDWSTAST